METLTLAEGYEPSLRGSFCTLVRFAAAAYLLHAVYVLRWGCVSGFAGCPSPHRVGHLQPEALPERAVLAEGYVASLRGSGVLLL